MVKSQHSSTKVIEITLQFVKNQFKNTGVTNFLKFNIKNLIWFPAWVVQSMCWTLAAHMKKYFSMN